MLRRLVGLFLAVGLAAGISGCEASLDTTVRSYKQRQTAAAAAREGQLLVYANTGDVEVAPLIEAFERRYPGVVVRYERQNASQLHDRFLAEIQRGAPTADLVWSSAMDQQIKLINDGYARTFVSTEKAALPSWAVWKDQGYGVTAEPIVFAYDRRRLDPAKVPRSHAALRRSLEQSELPGPIATFDLERSGVGFLFYSQDRSAWADTRALNRAMGEAGVRLYTSSSTLLEDLGDGKASFGYNIIGSYAQGSHRKNPNLTVVFPSDYTLIQSRIAFISRQAAHPNAARLFLDFLLSREGQQLLADSSLRPVRRDLAGGGVPGPAEVVARPIEVGPSLLANLDQMRRARLLADWQGDIGPRRVYDLRRARDSLATGKPQ